MKIPLVKEHGSWAVFIFSCAAAVTTGLLTRPWHSARDFSDITILTIMGLVLLINSKSPLMSAVRTKEGKKEHLLWFASFCIFGCILLIPFLNEGFRSFLFFSPLVLSYLVLILKGKEHNLLTELNGFALLILSAPIVYFVITGELSLRLFFAVFVFFASGVFKVRARIKKTHFFRWIAVVYCAFAFIIFHSLLNISPVVLLPLVENIVSMVRMREEKLRTTGNIELIKGLVFTSLLGIFWQ
jgi:hypothetical protein